MRSQHWTPVRFHLRVPCLGQPPTLLSSAGHPVCTLSLSTCHGQHGHTCFADKIRNLPWPVCIDLQRVKRYILRHKKGCRACLPPSQMHRARTCPTAPSLLPMMVNGHWFATKDFDIAYFLRSQGTHTEATSEHRQTLVIMRSDHFTEVPIPDAHRAHDMEYVDVAIIGGGPGGLSAGVAVSIADPSLAIRVSVTAFPGTMDLFKAISAQNTVFNICRCLSGHHHCDPQASSW